MQNAIFPTPEDAAMDGFPAVLCRVVAAAREGDDAFVVVDTGPAGHPYLYGVALERGGGGWSEVASGNGPGWTVAGGEDELGTLHLWGPAPDGATRVRAAYGGDVRERPVSGGFYLMAWWRVPAPEEEDARVEAFHVGGQWRPASGG
jgi:hypothetical protein